MKQRLQTLLSSERISSSKFADIIGVNRSSVSHLLSGRNNPSLDILQKVLTKFPHINPDWLMLGQGNMYRNQQEKSENTPVNTELFSSLETTEEEPLKQENAKPKVKASNDKTSTVAKPIEKVQDQTEETIIDKPIINTEKEIEKIVFFYSDHTFDTYYPGTKE